MITFSGVNGLLIDCFTDPPEKDTPYALSVRTQTSNLTDVKHFKVYFDQSRQTYALANTVQFASLDEMFNYYKGESARGKP